MVIPLDSLFSPSPQVPTQNYFPEKKALPDISIF